CCFFFQAEDGIRDFHVTGVQTCALPISREDGAGYGPGRGAGLPGTPGAGAAGRRHRGRVCPYRGGRSALSALYVCATPIGNLEDVTLRLLRVLREVAVIGAEDTRRTRRLCARYGIETPLVSCHEHNEEARAREFLAHLAAGRPVAYVTDAGTPGIADPGPALVRRVRAAGYPVVPVP